MTEIKGHVELIHGTTTHRITIRMMIDDTGNDPMPFLIIITKMVRGERTTLPMVEDSPAIPVHTAWAVVCAQVQQLCAQNPQPECLLHLGFARSAFKTIYDRFVHQETMYPKGGASCR